MLSKIQPYLLIVLLVSFLIFVTKATGASDANLTCGSSGCSGISGAIFNETNLAPGAHVSKTVTAVNNYPEDRNFGVSVESASFNDSIPSLAQEFVLTIKDNAGGNIVYGPKTILDWKNDGLVVLSQIASGGSKEFLFEVSFNDVGNPYQGKTLSFDLNLGFEGGGVATVSGPSTSSGSQTLGSSTQNILGEVLGLSATGRGMLFSTLLILGIFLMGLGGIIILTKTMRNRAHE